jgi:hypothetical protein
VKGKNGKQIMTIDGQVQRWLEHFDEILSTPAQEVEHNLIITPHLIPINENPPRHTEVVKVIKQLKKKAVGPDGIPPEIFTACPNTMATLIEPLIKTIYIYGS